MGLEVGLLLGHKGVQRCTKVYKGLSLGNSVGTTVGSSHNLMQQSTTTNLSLNQQGIELLQVMSAFLPDRHRSSLSSCLGFFSRLVADLRCTFAE